MTKMLMGNIGLSIERKIAKLKALRSIIRRIGYAYGRLCLRQAPPTPTPTNALERKTVSACQLNLIWQSP